MSILDIPTARVFQPLLKPARYKGAKGGRGSGKSQFFGGECVSTSVRRPGLRILCGREIQKSLKESAKRLIEKKIEEYGQGHAFEVLNNEIRTPGGGVMTFIGLQDHTAESIKSYEDYDIFWAEEAQTISAKSWQLIRPTIRKENSEIWASWNPRRKTDAVDEMLTGPTPPTDAAVVTANWSDNPWFPDVLEQERRDCLANDPDQYEHIWEGGYATVQKGAYFAQHLAKARAEGRIGNVAADPLMQLRAFWDIGGTGAKADACAIWIVQFVGLEIRVLDYYEAVGQPIDAHVTWLHESGYGKALCTLPHDGDTNDRVYDVSYASALRAAGFKVVVIPNQGAGAAAGRIEKARRLFPSIWFNKPTVDAGLQALGWYHEKRDDARNIGLGPEHDWSSHGADAFGLMCVAHEAPRTKKSPQKSAPTPGGWMG